MDSPHPARQTPTVGALDRLTEMVTRSLRRTDEKVTPNGAKVGARGSARFWWTSVGRLRVDETRSNMKDSAPPFYVATGYSVIGGLKGFPRRFGA